MKDRFAGTVQAPEFPADVEWISPSGPVRLSEQRGHLVILDFWTFC